MNSRFDIDDYFGNLGYDQMPLQEKPDPAVSAHQHRDPADIGELGSRELEAPLFDNSGLVSQPLLKGEPEELFGQVDTLITDDLGKLGAAPPPAPHDHGAAPPISTNEHGTANNMSQHAQLNVPHTGPPKMTVSTNFAAEHHADPVINVVAPDEAPFSHHFSDEAYPMYSVHGVPVKASLRPEFQAAKNAPYDFSAEFSANGTLPSPSGSSNASPFGTPLQQSAPGLPGTPSATSLASGVSPPAMVPVESPLISGGSAGNSFDAFDASPIGALYEEALSPLIEDEDLFSMESKRRLSVPQRGSRALSDSWSTRERDAFLESVASQTGLLFGDNLPEASNVSLPHGQVGHGGAHPPQPLSSSHSDGTHGLPTPHSSAGIGGDPLAMKFPDYSTKSNSSVDLNPPPVMLHVSSPVDHTPIGERAQQSTSSGSNQLFVPQTRHRSLSSPHEATNQMFSCDMCGKRFTRAYNLRSHMRTHTDERPFSCQHCGKAFARQHDRKRHEALHSGEKKFVCYGLTQGLQWGCNKRFARADALGRHFRTEAGKHCLKPLIERIIANGGQRGTAPEGILLTGSVNGHPKLVLTFPERDSQSTLSSHEREDQTRRTVIVTAVAEQIQGVVQTPEANGSHSASTSPNSLNGIH